MQARMGFPLAGIRVTLFHNTAREIMGLEVDQDITFFDTQNMLCQPIEANATYEVLGPSDLSSQPPACPNEEVKPVDEEGGEAEANFRPRPTLSLPQG